MKSAIGIFVTTLLLFVSAFIGIRYYSYIFAKHINGTIEKVERVTAPQTMIVSGEGKIPNEQIFSFAVSVKSADGEIHTASSEDRQWAVVQPGQCVEAKFFPYPFWNLEKYGTYYGARILRLSECK